MAAGFDVGHWGEVIKYLIILYIKVLPTSITNGTLGACQIGGIFPRSQSSSFSNMILLLGMLLATSSLGET
jgi:hypothetical protein